MKRTLLKSRVSQVLASVAKLFGQLVENILEDDMIDVLTEEVEQEPVSNPSLVHHYLHTVRLDTAVSQFKQVYP